MKLFVICWLGLSLFSATVTAQSVGRTNIPPSFTLAWTPDPASTNYVVAGYNLYMGGISGVYTSTIYIPGANASSAVVTNVVRGSTYYFVATALSTNGLESSNSVQVSATSPLLPPAPTGLAAVAQ